MYEVLDPYHPICSAHSHPSFTFNVSDEGTMNGCCHNLNVHSISQEYVARETPLRAKDVQLLVPSYPNSNQEVGCSDIGRTRKLLAHRKRKDVFMGSTYLDHDEYNKVLKVLPDIIPPSQMDLGSRWGL